MKSSHFYYIILFSFLLAACKDDGPGEKENSDNDVPSVATNTWLLNSLDNIENYSNSDPENRYDINMVRNEYESVQLVIQTDSKKSLKIERIGNNDAIEFQCRKLETFNGKYDVLIPCDNEIEPDDKVVRAWLTFKVKSEAEAKRHKEIIRFKTDDKEYAVAISINVVNASLPETECFSSPYAWNDDRTWEYLADKRFNHIALPSHGLSDGELEMMLNKARKTGLLNKAFFYVWDEPTKTDEYEQIKTLSDRIHRYAPEAKVLTTFYCGPTDGEHKDDLFAVFDILNGATSIYCTGVWALQDNENRSEQCKAKLKSGQEWWSYVCMSNTPGLASNSTAIGNRATMWRNYKEQNSGFLYWVVNGFASVYPLRPRPELPEGDGILIYPGESFGTNKICTSVRLERWRDGAEDYDMLVLYEKKLGRSAALSLLNNVYKSPSNYTDQSKYALALRKNLIENITE